MNELRSIDLTSGVNDKGEGFVTVSASSQNGVLMVGQMSPDDVRGMAMQWLEVAEAADQDAAAFRVCRKLELPDRMAALIVTELRESRGV